MKKAFLESKWWFYIPVVSMFFIPKMSRWVLDAKTTNDMQWRDIIIMYSLFIHVIPILWVITNI